MKILKSTKALIFDCDGTLVDSLPVHLEALRKAFGDYGTTVNVSFLKECNGMPASDVIEEYNRQNGTNIDTIEFISKLRYYIGENLQNVKPIEAVVDIVKANVGKMPMAVASGGILKDVTTSLNAIGLLNKFDVIITADDPVSPKPSPDIFLEAARRMDVAPENCQVFEDGAAGIKAANLAGIPVIDVCKHIS